MSDSESDGFLASDHSDSDGFAESIKSVKAKKAVAAPKKAVKVAAPKVAKVNIGLTLITERWLMG
jgi:hypothetical protein